MLAEMLGKGGQVCNHAKQGAIHCPLMIRPTSEDVITGEVFQQLKIIRPRFWLPQLLNAGLQTKHYRQQVFRGFRIDLWRNLPLYPRHLLPWSEGSTQIDVTIRWENPPTTILLEAKYLSKLATQTTNTNGQRTFPNDQLLRNVRVGLWECGWIQEPSLFSLPRRNIAVLLWSPRKGEPLVAKYRQPSSVAQAIPQAERLLTLPKTPFVGEVSYRDLIQILQGNQRWMLRPERLIAEDLCDYLRFKMASAHQQLEPTVSQASRLFPEPNLS